MIELSDVDLPISLGDESAQVIVQPFHAGTSDCPAELSSGEAPDFSSSNGAAGTAAKVPTGRVPPALTDRSAQVFLPTSMPNSESIKAAEATMLREEWYS